jgi:hypothetical protein
MSDLGRLRPLVEPSLNGSFSTSHPESGWSATGPGADISQPILCEPPKRPPATLAIVEATMIVG